jgi:Lon protease-like protein
MNLLVTNLHLERLPLFPLPGTVFFPNTLLPLHVFEPRYRALTQHCIDKQWPMAVVLIEPGHEADQAGTPPIAQLAGIGHLVMHDRLTDGRFDIMLQGLSRVQILEELPTDASGYRTARAQLVSDYIHPDRELLQQKTHAVRSALTSLVARDRKIAEMVSAPFFSTRSPVVLADALSALIFADPVKRQELLACTRVHERLDHVLERLTDLLVISAAAGTPGADAEAN